MSAWHRWLWLYRFVTAALRLALHALGFSAKQQGNLTFAAVAQRYIARVSQRLTVARPCLAALQPDASHLAQHLPYLFHLEAELWGVDGENYITRTPQDAETEFLFQTFRLPMAFFVAERWLNAAWPRSADEGRGSQRKRLFGRKDGLFSTRCPAAWHALGLPFALRADTQRVIAPDGLTREWARLARYRVSQVVAAALVNTRKKLPHKIRAWPKRARGIFAWWYDVWWVYSESVRYRPLHVDKLDTWSPTNAFHWNLSLRWLTSLWLLGIGQIVFHSLPPAERPLLTAIWDDALARWPVLARVYASTQPYPAPWTTAEPVHRR